MTPTSPPSLIARVAGVLYVFGAFLVALSLSLPHPASADEGGLYAVVAAAAVGGLAFLALAERMRLWTVHALIALGSALICLTIFLSGTAAGVYSTMFVWVVVLTAYFFPGRGAAVHLAWLLTVYAATLTAIEDSSGYAGFTRWLLVALSLTIASGVTAWVVRHGRSLERRMNRFFGVSPDMFCTASAEGRFVEVNEAWTRTLGHSRADLISRPFVDFVHPDDRERTEAEAAALFAGEARTNFENRYRAADGSWRWLRWTSTYDPAEGLIYARAADVTEHRQLEDERERLLAEVEDQARTDPLTGLPNRRWLQQELEREIARAERQGFPLCAAIVDLDRFKAFNDRLGHLEGDRLLCQAADAWRGMLRVSDFLARYGGEEFVVLLPSSSPAEAEAVVERLRSAVPRGETCSAGLAPWRPGTSIEQLLAEADAALYEAKARGRDQVVMAGAGVAG